MLKIASLQKRRCYTLWPSPPAHCIFKMAAHVEEEPDLPEEVTESLETFHEALGKVEDVFKPVLETSVDDLKEKVWSSLYKKT